MPLHAPGPRRERILGYGESNAGKSTLWTSIAEWIHKTKSSSHMWVVDTDMAWEAMRPPDGHLDSVVTVFDAPTYQEQKDAVKAIFAKPRSADDWLVYDMIDKLWSQAQRHFWNEMEGDDLGDLFLRAKTDNFSIAGDYGSNWGVINKLYDDVFGRLYRWKGHLYCASPATDVRQPNAAGKGGDDIKIRQLFEKVKLQPQGQKDLPFLFHTIIFCQESPSGWRLTTVKDRQRERVQGKVVSTEGGFPTSYLIPVGGWKL